MLEVLERNPHATEIVRDWFINKMEESIKDQSLPDNFKSFMREQGVPNDRLVKLIEVNPRVLFDVFDENGVVIDIMYSNDSFTWDVNYTKSETPYSVKSIELYASRKSAERYAVERAFQMLNDKLKP